MLPVISDRQSWCCDNGCGECAPVQIDFEYSRTEDMSGNLIESKTEKIWVSKCCNADLLLWDEDKQDFVDWRPIENGPVGNDPLVTTSTKTTMPENIHDTAAALREQALHWRQSQFEQPAPAATSPQVQGERDPMEGLHAGFWLRFGALVVDVLALSCLVFLVNMTLAMAVSPVSPLAVSVIAVAQMVLFVAGVAYFVFMESGSKQGTLGKMAMGIKVVDLSGNRISVARSMTRYAGKVLSGFALCIGYFMVGFTKKKQGFHDLVSGCLVVKNHG